MRTTKTDERNYLMEYILLWLKAGIAYAIGGFILGAMAGGEEFSSEIGIYTALIMFGFTFFNKVVRFNLFGNHDAVIIFWLLKILISAAIGIIAFPIVNIFYIIMIIRSIVYKLQRRGQDI